MSKKGKEKPIGKLLHHLQPIASLKASRVLVLQIEFTQNHYGVERGERGPKESSKQRERTKGGTSKSQS